MYWIGLMIALLGGLTRISLFRKTFERYLPSIGDIHFEWASIILLILGLLVTTTKYLVDQHQIENLEEKVALLEYQEISTYDASGNKSGTVGGIPMVGTPINDWNTSFVVREEGKIICKCSESAISTCKSVAQKLPLYPFSLYFLSICLKENGDPSWKEKAEKAKFIFEKTTKIPGHRSDHDQALSDIITLLKF